MEECWSVVPLDVAINFTEACIDNNNYNVAFSMLFWPLSAYIWSVYLVILLSGSFGIYFNYSVLRISMHSTIWFRVHVIVPLVVTGSGLLVAIDTSFQVPDSHMIMYHAARRTDL